MVSTTTNASSSGHSSRYATLAAELELIAQGAPPALIDDEPVRKRLLNAITNALPEVETKNDSIQRILYTPLEIMSARIAFDMDLFGKLIRSERPLTSQEIATSVNGDVILVDRLLRFISSLNMIKEVSVGLWGPSKLSYSFNDPGVDGGVSHQMYNLGQGWLSFPSYLQKHSYRTSNTNTDAAFNHQPPTGTSASLSFFEFCAKNPVHADYFNAWMLAQRHSGKYFLDGLPFKEMVMDKAVPGKVVWVDVGGGRGHQCKALKDKYPDLKGRVILEDQPSVLQDALSIEGVENVPVNFFEEQPIKGAQVYYLRNILHDWNDNDCRKILTRTAAAMSPSSLLFVDEQVIPAKGAHKLAMQIDMTMCVAVCAEERSEPRWRELLSGTGFKVEGIYTYQAELGDSIIVASLA